MAKAILLLSLMVYRVPGISKSRSRTIISSRSTITIYARRFMFEKKYKMSFKEFRDQEILKKLNYSLEAESDFCDWEMAITGIEYLQKDLAELKVLL